LSCSYLHGTWEATTQERLDSFHYPYEVLIPLSIIQFSFTTDGGRASSVFKAKSAGYGSTRRALRKRSKRLEGGHAIAGPAGGEPVKNGNRGIGYMKGLSIKKGVF
jgi:hypothetical protein